MAIGVLHNASGQQASYFAKKEMTRARLAEKSKIRKMVASKAEQMEYARQSSEFRRLDDIARRKAPNNTGKSVNSIMRERNLLMNDLIAQQPFGDILDFINQ